MARRKQKQAVVVLDKPVWKTLKGNFTQSYKSGYRMVVPAGSSITVEDAEKYGYGISKEQS